MESRDRRPLGVTAFFGLLGEQFVQGRLEEMASHWAFPCPMEVDGQLVVMRSPEVFVTFLAERRRAALSRGLTAMMPRISAIEMPRKGRFRVWLRWVFHYGSQADEEEDHGMVYFMAAGPDGRLTIEMMDVVHIPVSRAAAQSA